MKYMFKDPSVLLLEDGTIFYGSAVGKKGTSYGELCFNTGMTGYQEIFTDPSYFGQLVVTTNAHIGNYGTCKSDIESDSIKIAGLICKNFSLSYSRSLANEDLLSYFSRQNKIVISDVDTRAVVRHIRDKGAMNSIISSEILEIDKLREILSEVPSMENLELVSKVSTKSPYFFGEDTNSNMKIAVLDLGLKKSILKNLSNRGCYIKVFPYDCSFEEISSWNPDGYVLSNGPGDPTPLRSVQKLAKTIIDRKLPLFGICLGHQIIALANDIPTYKMHKGHRGINHPVKNLLTQRGEITSQNHGFVVDKEAVKKHQEIDVTHIHLNDQTIAGMCIKDKNCFSVQYHPESGPGPHDSYYLFDQFIESVKQYKKTK
ncbi:glutamine-hydrolyzing carbamoyl-phosphate synthase small subunit [Ichthyobacterium seriolicida]|uniref:Carbamoyl phosphate synthase small chain n=1 Tax=Ichthyobacterium seriolicida TaxID=242600 RepID=A0A1J1EB34_9FLAO|nr:glutamine-hydrolyzing carbamoyl-phosphate synthase small subunit [Ichthyobacterium seriolicida]BAV94728.1 carbamoyl-phosphate synthase small chain [Ichthyobacterium seriolicida]